MESSKNAKHNNFESILAKVGVDLAKNEHRRDLEKGDHCTVTVSDTLGIKTILEFEFAIPATYLFADTPC